MRERVSRIFNAIWYREGVAWVALWPLSWVYRFVFAIARRRGIREAHRNAASPVPVVVIGNITVGGTGKTPLIIWLARELGCLGFNVGIISRGYGGERATTARLVTAQSDPALVGDEAVLLSRRTNCPLAIGADRVAARDLLVASHPLDVVLSDDGLQHHRLPRDYEIVVIDGSRGLGNGCCLPAGPLREPVVRLADVDIVVINGAGWSYPGAIRANTRIETVRRLRDGVEQSIGAFSGRTAHAYAAIGNPESFFTLLRSQGLDVVPHPLADHAWIEAVEQRFSDTTLVMLTEKDAVKYRDALGGDVWCVIVDMEFQSADCERMLAELKRVIKDGS